MSFIAAAIIGGVGVVAGSAIASKGAKSAAKTAAQGSANEIEFNRESRDLARADQAPYVSAGHTALGALMDMTGLSAIKSSPTGGIPDQANRREPLVSGYDYLGGFQGLGGRSRVGGRGGFGSSGYTRQGSGGAGGGITRTGIYDSGRIRSRYEGGVIQPNQPYTMNEMGPENVYQRGSYTRDSNPKMVSPSATGYVQPNKITPPWGGGEPRTGPPKIPSVLTGEAGVLPYEVPQGLPSATTAVGPNGYPAENPGGVEGGYSFKTDPGYQFRFSEGMRALDRGAAAAGGLLSGGYGRRAIRYGQDYASQEYTNVYNRIANIAGLGQVSGTASGNAALTAGARMGNAASEGALSSAYGQQASANAWASGLNQIAKLPWGSIGSTPGGDSTYRGVGGAGAVNPFGRG